MKKMFVLMAMFCLCLQATAVYAATPNFSGEWELDASRSTLPDTLPIETMTLKVRQTEKSLQFESSAKTSQKVDAGTKSKTGFLTQTASFILESEATNPVDGGNTTAAPREKASVTADGRLNLTIVRNFQNEMGNFTMKINEIWELLDNGETLKVTHYTESLRGATNAEMYFTKKYSSAPYSGETANENKTYQAPAVSGATQVPKIISGGVLNGKALSLVKPVYPAEARASQASGAVNVKVTIDETGNIISAEAVSGDVLLRDASVKAAKKSKFAPTLLQGVPVKVTGIIVYNFAP